MKNEKLNNVIIKGAGVITAVSAGAMAVATHAAADTDLTNGIASTTAYFTDNKTPIIVFLVAALLIAFGIRLVMKALQRGTGMVGSAVKPGRRRR